MSILKAEALIAAKRIQSRILHWLARLALIIIHRPTRFCIWSKTMYPGGEIIAIMNDQHTSDTVTDNTPSGTRHNFFFFNCDFQPLRSKEPAVHLSALPSTNKTKLPVCVKYSHWQRQQPHKWQHGQFIPIGQSEIDILCNNITTNVSGSANNYPWI